jgi:hypothetical protein
MKFVKIQKTKRALQFVFDDSWPDEKKATVQSELNQMVANGFELVCCPVVGTKIYYQLIGDLPEPPTSPKSVLARMKGVKA